MGDVLRFYVKKERGENPWAIYGRDSINGRPIPDLAVAYTYSRRLADKVCTALNAVESLGLDSGIEEGSTMAKLKRKAFRVSVVMPVGGTIAQMRAFIEEAVTSYRHNLMNGEPEYEIDLKAIKVTALRERH